MNICAHQTSLRGFRMLKSYLSKVILPEWEVDLFLYICRDICCIARAAMRLLVVVWPWQVVWSQEPKLWPLSKLWLTLNFLVSRFQLSVNDCIAYIKKEEFCLFWLASQKQWYMCGYWSSPAFLLPLASNQVRFTTLNLSVEMPL